MNISKTGAPDRAWCPDLTVGDEGIGKWVLRGERGGDNDREHGR